MIAYSPHQANHQHSTNGFSLVLTLMVLAAITVIVVGLFTSTISDHSTSASYEAVDRAELALEAGFEHATALLLSQTHHDQYLILQQQTQNPLQDQYPKTLLIAAMPNTSMTAWSYTPLVSGLEPVKEVEGLPTLTQLQFEPKDPQAPLAHSNFKHIAWNHHPDTIRWQSYYDSSIDHPNTDHTRPRVSARYAFWIEDLQALVNLQSAGNSNGSNRTHLRTSATAPSAPVHVPGLNLTHSQQPLLNQTALYTLLNPAAPTDGYDITFDNWLIDQRQLLISPDMWKTVALHHRFPDRFLIRNRATKLFPETSLYDEASQQFQNAANVLDFNTTTGVVGYDELALIPAYPPQHGFAGQGKIKLNLNRLLHQLKVKTLTSEQAVERIAQHIDDHLPHFSERAGGFPFPIGGTMEQKRRGYLQALAASMLDYADEDSQPIVKEGAYRGIDAMPLVNEYFVKAKLLNITPEKTQVTWSLTFFMELWNLTNQPLAGEVQASFEYHNEVSIYADTYQPSSEVGLHRMIDPKPVLENGTYWFAPVNLTDPIAPNQHRVIKVGEVTFQHSITPIGEDDFQITIDEYVGDRYQLRYKGPNDLTFVLVDRPRGTVHRQDAVLKEGSNANKTKISSNGAAAQYGYTLSNTSWIAEKGDPRASFYLGEPRDLSNPASKNLEFQGAVSYAGGASPGGRNFRKNVTADPMRAYVETLVQAWPDSGHSIEAGKTPPSNLSDPDSHPLKDPGIPPKSPQIISNAGRYYSVTELGNIFDPHFWKPSGYEGLREQLHLFQDLKPGDQAEVSPFYAGGNTLRVGRVEHSRWRPDDRETPDPARPRHRGYSASALLDIFHVGSPTSHDPSRLTGNLQRIHPGQINLNTATKDTLRAILAGPLMMDPHSRPTQIYPPHSGQQADEFAQAIINHRPYLTVAEAADKVRGIQSNPNVPLFGNPAMYSHAHGEKLGDDHELNDAALEELFARLYNNSTVRSRNFRIHVVAQTLRHARSGEATIEATQSRIYHVYLHPERDANGAILRQSVHVTYVQNP